MDELFDLWQSILTELQEINQKLDRIQGNGIYDSISDICDKLDDLESTILDGSNY